jgi:DNA-binding response OmpR family regulator
MSVAPAHPHTAWPHLTVVTPPDILIEPWARTVYKGHSVVELTRREFDLLQFLAEHPRRVFTRPQLLTYVWGDLHTGGRTVDVHIRRLRAKLGDDLVTTVRGVGYRLADRVDIHVDAAPPVDTDLGSPYIPY